MKLYNYCLLIAVCIGFISCDREQKDFFSESSALRLNKAIEEAKNALLDAENGWIMEYFPTSSSRGESLLIKFENNGMATIAAQNQYFPTYTEDEGTFKVIGDNGPSLTFDTYNKVLHMFANPENPAGLGLQGDYEFIIIEVGETQIELKGKKRGTKIYLKKLGSDQEWTAILDQLNEVDNYLFSASVPTTYLQVNSTLFEATNGIDHIFSIALSEEEVPEKVPFIITPTGLRFYKPFKTEVADVQVFNFNSEKTKLVSEEDEAVCIVPPAPASYLYNTPHKYWAEKEDLGGNFLSLFEEMEEEFSTVYSGRRNLTSIGFSKKSDYFTFMLKTTGNEANFTIPYTIENDDQIIISAFDANNMSNSDMDNNARLFYTAISSVKKFLNAIQGSYYVKTQQPFTINHIQYIKTDNANEFIHLYK